LKIKKIGPKILDKEGKEAPGTRGYKYFILNLKMYIFSFMYYFFNLKRYFGAAKDLPGVKELFEQEGFFIIFDFFALNECDLKI
jgi:pre-mRNA-splicing factor ISY1